MPLLATIKNFFHSATNPLTKMSSTFSRSEKDRTLFSRNATSPLGSLNGSSDGRSDVLPFSPNILAPSGIPQIPISYSFRSKPIDYSHSYSPQTPQLRDFPFAPPPPPPPPPIIPEASQPTARNSGRSNWWNLGRRSGLSRFTSGSGATVEATVGSTEKRTTSSSNQTPPVRPPQRLEDGSRRWVIERPMVPNPHPYGGNKWY
jgi:hypothetical protein